ncbi:ssk1 response regulator receiver [Chytridiales sp. JEL 0842]|nr:ssk1 response regulator receiver [Chytridiales sp. JEL 0842]
MDNEDLNVDSAQNFVCPYFNTIFNASRALRSIVDHLKDYPVADHVKLPYTSSLASLSTGLDALEYLNPLTIAPRPLFQIASHASSAQSNVKNGELIAAGHSCAHDAGRHAEATTTKPNAVINHVASAGSSTLETKTQAATVENKTECSVATSSRLSLSEKPATSGPAFDPCDLNERVADFMEYPASLKDIEIIVQSPVQSEGVNDLFWAFGDENAMRHVLVQILSSIIKVAPRGSKSSVKHKKLLLTRYHQLRRTEGHEDDTGAEDNNLESMFVRDVIIIDGNLELLQGVLEYRIEHHQMWSTKIIYCTTPARYMQDMQLCQQLYTGLCLKQEKTSPVANDAPGAFRKKINPMQNIVICSKPVGPRKILLALRLALMGYNEDKEDVTIMMPINGRTQVEDIGTSLLRRPSTPSLQVQPKPMKAIERPTIKTGFFSLDLDDENQEGEVEFGGKLAVGQKSKLQPLSRHDITIMIVEDNPINGTILSKFLTSKGIHNKVVSNGLDAVNAYQKSCKSEEQVHIILMDLMMPVMSGIEASRKIREIETESQIPRTFIVAVTASTKGIQEISAENAGFNDYVKKPISLNWLEKRVAEWETLQRLIFWAKSS